MSASNFFKSKFSFVIFSFIAALVIGSIIVIGVFVWLDKYTQHGVETTTPNVCGMYYEEAKLTLAAQGLQMEIIDSTYTNKVPRGTIVEQNPPAQANVKHSRIIYVIMNARAPKQIPLPELHDVSYRQAQATLTAIGLEIEDVKYEPSEYRDLVLDIRLNGSSLEAGTRLQEGTAVLLVIGQGTGLEETLVPDLKGHTLSGARTTLLETRLVVGAVNYDDQEGEQPTEDQTYYVYDQRPRSGQSIREGSHVDLWLSTDPNKEAPASQDTEDDEFF